MAVSNNGDVATGMVSGAISSILYFFTGSVPT